MYLRSYTEAIGDYDYGEACIRLIVHQIVRFIDCTMVSSSVVTRPSFGVKIVDLRQNEGRRKTVSKENLYVES